MANKSPHQMSDPKSGRQKKDFRTEAISKEVRKLRARHERKVETWLGFEVMGLVGWSVSLGALIGAGLGVWIDLLRGVGCYAWTLLLLVLGIFSGFVLAFLLLSREMNSKGNNHDDRPR